MNAVELLKLAEHHLEMIGADGELACAYLRAREALREINRHNRLNNDLDAYLFDLAEWGIGETDERPKLESFGLSE